MPTPHISAADGDFAPDILLPGDSRRATRIAQKILDDARLVAEVRGIVGHTGTYQGRPVSLMASGLGMPPTTTYATELIRHYVVKRLVRVGTVLTSDAFYHRHGTLVPRLALYGTLAVEMETAGLYAAAAACDANNCV